MTYAKEISVPSRPASVNYGWAIVAVMFVAQMLVIVIAALVILPVRTERPA